MADSFPSITFLPVPTNSDIEYNYYLALTICTPGLALAREKGHFR